MNEGKGRGRDGTPCTTDGSRAKPKWRASQSVVRALLRRQALGKKGRLPSSHGLPKAPARLVYSMSNAIPIGQRHDRVLLGFTADGEHLVVCCGPLTKPCRLELRRVRLQWPGLSRPGEALWSLPLNLRVRGDPYTATGVRSSENTSGDGGIGQEEEEEEEDEEEEEEEEDAHGLGMGGMGGQEPASVSVTESADGFLVVVVVSLRYHSEMHEDEDRVYHVFVAPGPSYVASMHASVENPFLGVAFSYIVPGGGGAAPVPSLAAHDVGAVDAVGGGGGDGDGRGCAAGERVYVIILNAVDAIRALEVRLHMEGSGQGAPSPDVSSSSSSSSSSGRSRSMRCSPTPLGTKFTVRPPQLRPAVSSKGNKTDGFEIGRGVGGKGDGDKMGSRGGGSGGGGDGGDGGGTSATFDPSSVWWACGRDLPSSPLVGTRPLPSSSRRLAVGGAAIPATADVVVAPAPTPVVFPPSGRSSSTPTSSSSASGVVGAAAEGDGENLVVEYGGGGTDGGSGGGSNDNSGRTAAAAGRQGGAEEGEEGTARRLGGVEERPEAAAVAASAASAATSAAAAAVQRQESEQRRTRRSTRRRRPCASADKGRQRVLDLEVFISQLLLRAEAFPVLAETTPQPLPPPPPPQRKRKASDAGAASTATRAAAAAAAAVHSSSAKGESRRRRPSAGGGCESGSGVDGDGRKKSTGLDGDAADSSSSSDEGSGCDSDGRAPVGPPKVIATDYHCVTVGLLDGGRRVLLCLVVEVVYTGKRAGGKGDGCGGTPEAGGRGDGGGAAIAEGPGVLGYVLALDLECGEVAVLEMRSGRGTGKRCAPLCEALARSVRRSGSFLADYPGRRLSNTTIFQGRSLGAIVNPVFPVAIVRGGQDA